MLVLINEEHQCLLPFSICLFISFLLLDSIQALIAGLCVMLPEDPWEFAVDKLTTLISSRPVSIEWDMFIDTDMKPKRHLFFRNIMDSLMDWDENSQVKTTKTFHIRI
jgi:hypothetical protein